MTFASGCIKPFLQPVTVLWL